MKANENFFPLFKPLQRISYEVWANSIQLDLASFFFLDFYHFCYSICEILY